MVESALGLLLCSTQAPLCAVCVLSRSEDGRRHPGQWTVAVTWKAPHQGMYLGKGSSDCQENFCLLSSMSARRLPVPSQKMNSTSSLVPLTVDSLESLRRLTLCHGVEKSCPRKVGLATVSVWFNGQHKSMLNRELLGGGGEFNSCHSDSDSPL